jgi:hypothetical protein
MHFNTNRLLVGFMKKESGLGETGLGLKRGNTPELEERLAEESNFYLNRSEFRKPSRTNNRFILMLRVNLDFFGVGN